MSLLWPSKPDRAGPLMSEADKVRADTKAACTAADRVVAGSPPEPNGPRWDPDHARDNHDPTERPLPWLTGWGPIARGESS